MIFVPSLLVFLTTFICFPKSLDGASLTPIWFSDDPVLSSPYCTATDKPCDILVRSIINGNTTNEYRSSQSLCSCRGDRACPRGWDNDPDRTITRHLVTKGNEIMLQMKFCEPIQAQRECEAGDTAMLLTGGGIMPLEVVDVSCRCPGDTPLFLKESWSEGWRLYQKFRCQQDECGINFTQPPPCVRISRTNTPLGPTTTTHYPCRCAPGYMCSVDVSRIAHHTHINGHCERIIL
ncbi:hypothetical protein ScPMuIL_010110 [Solemya velum]